MSNRHVSPARQDLVVEELLAPHDQITVAQLAEFTTNQVVEYGDGNAGVVLEVYTDDFEWQGETREVGDEPIYVVARETGGTKPFAESELTDTDPDSAFKRDQADMDSPAEEVADAELSAVYERLDDLHDAAELANIPGVDDPGVGWDEYPDSWDESSRPNRLILLDMWTSMDASFTGCVREMSGRIRSPERFCAATKDEIYGNSGWRNSD